MKIHTFPIVVFVAFWSSAAFCKSSVVGVYQTIDDDFAATMILMSDGLVAVTNSERQVCARWREVRASRLDGRFVSFSGELSSVASFATLDGEAYIRFIGAGKLGEGVPDGFELADLKSCKRRELKRIMTEVPEECIQQVRKLAANEQVAQGCQYCGSWSGRYEGVEIAVSLITNRIGVLTVGGKELAFDWRSEPGSCRLYSDCLGRQSRPLKDELEYDVKTGALIVTIKDDDVRLDYKGSDIHPRLKRRLEMQKKLEKAARER